MRYIKLAAIAAFAAVMFSVPVSFAAAPQSPVISANPHLVQAYHTAWTAFKNTYADRANLADLDAWEHKFDADLRTQPDLDRALQQLITFVGDKNVTLITPSDVAKFHAVDMNQRLAFGLRFYRQTENLPDDTAHTVVKTATDVYGPAQQSGLLSADTVEQIHGVPAERLTDGELQALAGECTLGDKVRVKVSRRAQPIVIPCGLAPIAAQDSFSVEAVSAASAKGAEVHFIRARIANIDDTRIRSSVRTQLGTKDGETLPILFDLRGATGTIQMRAADLASLLLQQGIVSCEHGGDVAAQMCFLVDNGKSRDKQNDPKFKLASFMAHKGPIVVLIDGATAGTALTFAAALQAAGAKTIAIGDKTRRFDDVNAYVTLSGDPLSRSLLLPAFHIDQLSAPSFTTTESVTTLDEAMAKAAELLAVK